MLDHNGRGTAMKCSIEVVILPVADVDQALALYAERAGFTLDVDYAPSDEFRVAQLTPPGSSYSIQIGIGLTGAAPGSVRNLYAVVEDLRAAREELLERGVEIGEIGHKAPLTDWRGDRSPGLDPDRTDYASFANFRDPDGNQWVLQERGFRS
jgi:catechol 2,3-dioxygenase-like lactoylglutathione lyase family enzyme